MKRVAFGALGLLLGCNQIFGLKSTQQIDGSVDGAPPIPKKTFIEWQIPGLLASSGQPDPMLVYAGIGIEASRPDQPMIQVGPQLDATGDAGLSAALYDPTTGAFAVPDALLGQHWRMVYTLPGDTVPHEVQWTVSTAHLELPRLTRLDAAPVPSMSGYAIMPMGANGISAPVIMTSGVWTWSQVDNWTSDTFEFDYSGHARPITGPKGAPESAKGDWVLATDWGAPVSQFESSVIGWAWTNKLDLVQFIQNQPQTEPPWNTPPMSVVNVPGDTIAICARHNMVFGDFMGTSTSVTPCAQITEQYGLLAHDLLPAFGPDGELMLLPLDITTMFLSQLNFVDVDANTLPLPHALYAKVTTPRVPTAGGPTLVSSTETVETTIDSQGIPFNAALTTMESLSADGHPDVELNNDNQNLVLGGSDTQPVMLKFGYESAAVAQADDVLITLYQITGTTVTPVRTYLLADASKLLLIDPTVFKDGKDYVLSFVTHTGYPDSDTGDYRHVTYPFARATKFAGTFHVTVQ